MHGKEIIVAVFQHTDLSGPTSVVVDLASEITSLLLLQLNIQKTKIMASGPIPSWQLHGEKMETVADFTFLGSKSLGTVSAAMKLRCLLLGRKPMTNLDSVLKSRDMTLPTRSL